MLRTWEFDLPTRIRFGRGGFKELGRMAKEYGISAMLVGYRDHGPLEEMYRRAAAHLVDAGLTVTEFFEVPPDPDAELGAEGAERAAEAKVDVVVGLGGGSAIDAAKGIAALVKMGGRLWDYTGANQQSRPITESLPLVAVPTTAGTGTEATAVAVFTHHGVGAMPEYPLKASVSGPAVRPKVALVDPELMVGSPRRLTAACGADALGHAIEACMSRRANPVSSALAVRAVSLIVQNLQQAVEFPDDPEPREPLALASTLAGAAFSVAGVTMTHSIAQALGGLLHIPHGEAVAIATPLNLRYNAQRCVDVYCELAHGCGIVAASPQQQATRFVARIVELLRAVGLPDKVKAPQDAPEDLAEKLAHNAIDGTPVPIKLNPRKIDLATLKGLLDEIIVVDDSPQ